MGGPIICRLHEISGPNPFALSVSRLFRCNIGRCGLAERDGKSAFRHRLTDVASVHSTNRYNATVHIEVSRFAIQSTACNILPECAGGFLTTGPGFAAPRAGLLAFGGIYPVETHRFITKAECVTVHYDRGAKHHLSG
jgi:hypothetical protein